MSNSINLSTYEQEIIVDGAASRALTRISGELFIHSLVQTTTIPIGTEIRPVSKKDDFGNEILTSFMIRGQLGMYKTRRYAKIKNGMVDLDQLRQKLAECGEFVSKVAEVIEAEHNSEEKRRAGYIELDQKLKGLCSDFKIKRFKSPDEVAIQIWASNSKEALAIASFTKEYRGKQ